MGTKAISDASFQADVLDSDTPVLVDFWAEWCGPCKMIAPALDELAETYEGRLKVVKLNVDENPLTQAKYRVTSIPTLNVYSGGEVVKQIIGARPKSVILKELADYID